MHHCEKVLLSLGFRKLRCDPQVFVYERDAEKAKTPDSAALESK